jgi:hypothetical protein
MVNRKPTIKAEYLKQDVKAEEKCNFAYLEVKLPLLYFLINRGNAKSDP